MPSATTSDYVYFQQMEYFFYNNAFDAIWGTATDIYVGLFTTAPNLAGDNAAVEVYQADTSYTRQPVDRNNLAAGWSKSSTQYSNAAELSWAAPTANWGTVNAAVLFWTNNPSDVPPYTGDDSVLFVANLTTPKTVNNGDGGPKILANQLRIDRATC